MDENLSLNSSVDTLFSNLESFTQNEGVLGKPVTLGDKTLIPVVSVTLGYGTGNSAAKANQKSGGSGTGVGGNAGMDALGLGARLSTEAVVVIDKDNISMLSLGATSNMSQVIDKIPQMFGIGQNNQQNQQQSQQNGQQSKQQQ